jgi:transcriptional regulator with XRE-family HTH domain
MSTEITEGTPQTGGFPELSPLGKRIELLRIERGLSKQRLAREAGTSRQQLWRVTTGKSELTSALCQRLAEVLRIDARLLRGEILEPEAEGLRALAAAPVSERPPAPDLASYVATEEHLVRTLRTLPGGASGERLKRALLNCIEEVARAEGLRLPSAFFERRGRVVNGES